MHTSESTIAFRLHGCTVSLSALADLLDTMERVTWLTDVCTNRTDDGSLCGESKYCESCFGWLTLAIANEGWQDTPFEICVESSDEDGLEEPQTPHTSLPETPIQVEIWADTLAEDEEWPPLREEAEEPEPSVDEPLAKKQRITGKQAH